MNNISQISKAKRLTEEEVHAAAEELQLNGGKVGSIEVYRFLGRGSLTTITNFLKTWHQEEKVTALPALTLLPEALKKSAEQLIVKVWAESQAIAEQEIKSQQEALRQAEALANEKITEAEAFSEEQSKKIEALEIQIEELKAEKSKDHEFFESKIEELKKIITLSELKTAKQETENAILKNELISERQRSEEKIKIHENLIEKAAKLEGELLAWKEIKPETQKEGSRKTTNKNNVKTKSPDSNDKES